MLIKAGIHNSDNNIRLHKSEKILNKLKKKSVSKPVPWVVHEGIMRALMVYAREILIDALNNSTFEVYIHYIISGFDHARAPELFNFDCFYLI